MYPINRITRGRLLQEYTSLAFSVAVLETYKSKGGIDRTIPESIITNAELFWLKFASKDKLAARPCLMSVLFVYQLLLYVPAFEHAWHIIDVL